MTVRWKSGDFKGVPSGYNGQDTPSDIRVPSCGIEDVDESLFRLFDSEIGFQVINTVEGKKGIHKVPVFFGVGEKWAAVKKKALLRDKQGTLVLPLISIRRLSIDQRPDQDQAGRGINQATGELVIRRQLGTTDRDYQNLLNKSLIPNQDNLPTSSLGFPVGSGRLVGENAYDPDISRGALLSVKSERNVWEIITIPSPQFFTANYEVTFWTQYTPHMNQMIQRLLASYLPQLPSLKLTTTSGYWFVAYVNGDFKSEDNFDDLVETERLLKYTFSLKVPAYTVAPDESGLQSPIKRFISAPEATFDISSDTIVPDGTIDQGESPSVDGADDPTLGYTLEGEVMARPQQERDMFVTSIQRNPFTGKASAKYIKVVSVNARVGETVFSSVNPGIEIELE